jgi:hypothetical protein
VIFLFLFCFIRNQVAGFRPTACDRLAIVLLEPIPHHSTRLTPHLCSPNLLLRLHLSAPNTLQFNPDGSFRSQSPSSTASSSYLEPLMALNGAYLCLVQCPGSQKASTPPAVIPATLQSPHRCPTSDIKHPITTNFQISCLSWPT